MMSVETAMPGIASRMRVSQSGSARVGRSAASPSGPGPTPIAAGSGCARRPSVALRHRLDDVGREVVRVRRGEPDPPQTVDLVDLSQQLREQGLARGPRHGHIPAVGVHVLARAASPRRPPCAPDPGPPPGCRRSIASVAAPGRAARCRTCRRCRSPGRSRPRPGRRRRARPAERSGRAPCTRARPSAARRPRARRSRSSSWGSACVPTTTSTHGAFSWIRP